MTNAPDVFEAADAQILDRGYRHYAGERTGVRGAISALVRHSVQRGLGMRRTIWAKILPVATTAIAYIPAIVFVGVVALIPARNLTDFVLPSYGEYYGYVIAAIMLFVSLAAPEMLCTDRRTGMLGVYLSSPLDRDTYLLAKSAAVAFVLSLVCLGPPLLMLIANLLQSQGPEGFVEILETFARVVGAGACLALLYTGVTVGVASLTDRKSIAAAGIILLFLVSITITGILSANGSYGVRLGSVTMLSLDLASRVHGEPSQTMPGVSSGAAWAAWFAWTCGGFALARFRLHTLPVTR